MKRRRLKAPVGGTRGRERGRYELILSERERNLLLLTSILELISTLSINKQRQY